MRHFPDLSCMVVDLLCFSVVTSLTSRYAFLLLFFLRHASTSWHLPGIQATFAISISVLIFLLISIVFGSVWLPSRFLQVSSLVTKIKDLRGNPGLPLPAFLVKKSSCCISCCLVEVGDHGVQINIFIYQFSKRCKSTTCSCMESTNHCWSIQLLEVKPGSWLGWFP